MPDSQTRDVRQDGSLLSRVVAEYIEAAEWLDDSARQHLRDSYLAAHPELADRLKSHFDDEDFVGQTLRPLAHLQPNFARYSQLSKIGHGAMGVVYKGFDEELKRWVALKIATVGDASPAEARRIRREAESMARLTHRNIVKVYDVREEGGSTVISMELIPDGSLEDHRDELASDQRAIARMMVDLARAVHHAHQRGILHRDLKPANVLVAREEHGVFHPYVSDFGLAKPMDAAETHTDTGTAAGPGTIAYGRIVGTASYMSPEQAAGHRATTLSDVYGLGAIMYALLTGRAPFRGDTAGDTLALVRDARRPVRPTQLNSRTDRTLESICMMCLRKNPDERYRSAEGLARDLDRWLAHRPTDARRLGMPARARLWCRRNPVGAGLVAALVALTLLSGFELADRLSAPRRARLVVAEQTAALLVSRLTDIKRAVEATAARRDLSALLLQRDFPALQALIDEEGRRHDDIDGSSPFASLFVIDARDGAMVVRWPESDPASTGIDLRRRDYYRGLLASASSGAYVSRAFRGVTDKLFRFGVSAPLILEGQTVGVVVGTVTTDDRMGLPDVPHEAVVTAVLARRDPSPLPGERGPDQADASEYVILQHPAYMLGIEPRWLPRAYLPELTAGEASDYRDPVGDHTVESARPYRGTWVATFAPVTGTDFIVVVQQR